MDKDGKFVFYLNEAGINFVKYDPKHKKLFIRYHNPETNPRVVSLITQTIRPSRRGRIQARGLRL